MKSNFIGIFIALLLGTVSGSVSANDSDAGLTTQAARMDRYTSPKGQATVISKTAADFSSFYDQGNAQALANGLRGGTEIHLVTYGGANGETVISEASFTPPTGSMGNGNVYISMALAQQRLIAAGIAHPTAQQIQAAMVGGPLVSGGQALDGVLQMRASGMGWGQIAHSIGANLGHVISGMKSANAALAHTTSQRRIVNPAGADNVGAAKPKASARAGGSGVVTAGDAGGANVVGSKASGGKRGIVTGAGAGNGVPSAGGTGSGQMHGAGIVTGGGQGNAYGKGGK